MTQADWLAYFARRDAAARAAIAESHRRIGAKVAAERAPLPLAAAPLIVTPSVEVESDSGYPGRVLAAALAHGWWARRIESAAVHPIKGYVDVTTVRAGRHDERLFAAWWNGAFDGGWYLSSTSPIERLGWARVGGKRVKPLAVRGVLDAIEGIRISLGAVIDAEEKITL